MSSTMPEAVEEVLAKLAKDVEQAVHAMYRREVGPGTAQVRTEQLVHEARDRMGAFFKVTPSAAPSAPPPRFSAVVAASSIPSTGGDAEWTDTEAAAVTRCVMAWLPMGSPASAKPDSRCMAPGRELIPSWEERELARQAVRKIPVRGQ